MPRVIKVVKSRKECKDSFTGEVIPVGSPYYWWQFMRSPKSISVKPPTKRQLTRSGFQLSMYDIEDAIEALTASESIEEDVQAIIDSIQDLKSEVEDSLSNMPEQLQEADTGQLLQERIEALENWANELEGVDKGVDEEGLREEASDGLDKEADKEKIEELYQEKLSGRCEEILEEVQNISCEL